MTTEFVDSRNYHSDGDDDEAHMMSIQRQDDRILTSPPDNSSLLVELAPEDFPTYFSERGGRLFHSHTSSPYPLPADTPEQQRLNVTHSALKRLIGANYVGPVPDILTPDPRRQKIAVDLCTGTGKWVMDMARDFPHVLFRGLDIVPIATRYPLANVQFEVHDVSNGYRWHSHTIDFVHARSVSMAIRDYPSVIQEVGRVLRPGGLFVSGEWGRYPAFHPAFALDPPSHAPGAHRFFEILSKELEACRGIQPIASHVPSFLHDSGLFGEITPHCFYMPIGPWHSDVEMKRLGRAFRAALVRYAASVEPLLIEAGWSEGEVADIVGEYVHELKTVRGMISEFHTVHARRL